MQYACIGKTAKTPYYLPELGIHIYSIEELCYYFYRNYIQLDSSVMREELCTFVEKELELRELGRRMYDLKKANGSLAAFVSLVLETTYYCSREDLKEIEQQLRENASMDPGERKKVRGDFFLSNGRCVEAIELYHQAIPILQGEDKREILSKVYHNMGTSYAQMFQFDLAKRCYLEANNLFESEENYMAYLATIRLGNNREKYLDIILTEGLSQERVTELEGKIGIIMEEEKQQPEYHAFKKAMKLRTDGNVVESYQAISDIIAKWKQEYRRNMEKES